MIVTRFRAEGGSSLPAQFLLLAAALLILLPALVLDVKANGQNLRVLRAVDPALTDPLGRLALQNPGELASPLWQARRDDCLGLTQSRVWASYDLLAARESLASVDRCSRDLTTTIIWSGNLAWLRGDNTEAIEIFQQLTNETLLTYTRTLFLTHEHEGLADALLSILVGRAEDTPANEQNRAFFAAVGELNRLAGQEASGLSFYLAAWRSGEHSYETAYYLGKGLAGLGNCEQAIGVLEIGMASKPQLRRPQLDISYQEVLGQCYMELGQTGNARSAYDQARHILTESRTRLSPDAYALHLGILERMAAELGGQ